MTEQEYNEIMENLDSDDVLLRIQAQFIKSMFPFYGSGQTYVRALIFFLLRHKFFGYNINVIII